MEEHNHARESAPAAHRRQPTKWKSETKYAYFNRSSLLPLDIPKSAKKKVIIPDEDEYEDEEVSYESEIEE